MVDRKANSMSVVDDLKAIGGEGVEVHLGGFNQGSFRKGIPDVGGVDITGGYCAGVVLDWARRVLQSDSTRDQKYLSYSTTNAQARSTATVKRMALAYAGQAPTYMTGETLKPKVMALLQQLKTRPITTIYPEYGEGVLVTLDDVKLLKIFWKIPAPETIFSKFDCQFTQAGTLSYNDIDFAISNLTAKTDPQLSGGSSHGRHWESFAAQLDARLTEQRTDRGGVGTPKRLFSNLKVVASEPVKNYEEAGQWSYKLMNYGFQNNCCTVVTFSPSEGGSGHAVAVHQKANDEFVFFDPNYGAFRYSKENLKQCFQHLFWAPYIKAAKGVLDGEKAVYLRRAKTTDKVEGVWNKMGYTIFGV
jgi:hypothetical protein